MNIVDPVPVTPATLILLPTASPWAVLVVTVTIPARVVVIPAIEDIPFTWSETIAIPLLVVWTPAAAPAAFV